LSSSGIECLISFLTPFLFLLKQKLQIMKLEQASRKQSKVRLGIQGPSGSGKSVGALQVAFGLTNDWSKVSVIDTEYGSANLYSHLGPYNVLSLTAPFSPAKYEEAIHTCESAGMEVIIIDSISHEWDGIGGILDIHSSMAGNSFTNWGKLTPRHNAFVQTILQSPCHILVTIRSKQDYVLADKNGKMVPEKVGLKGVQRDGLEYELTTLFELDIKHFATSSKDRTSLFGGVSEFKLSQDIGRKLLEWCNQGTDEINEKTLIERINEVRSVSELLELYKNNPAYQDSLHQEFASQRKRLDINKTVHELIQNKNQSTNGKYDVN
jgi:AAA domain